MWVLGYRVITMASESALEEINVLRHVKAMERVSLNDKVGDMHISM